MDELVVSGIYIYTGFPGGTCGKESAYKAGDKRDTQVQSLGQENTLEKEMATHSSILAWKIPWMEEPGRLPSMGLQRRLLFVPNA